MRDASEHRDRWQDDVAAYALDALPPREAEIFEAHLEGCEACREQLRWLTVAVDQIPQDVEQLPAPPQLRDRLLSVVDSEAEVPRETTAPEPAPETRVRRLPSFLGGFSMRPALAGLAAALVLVAGVVGYQLHDSGGDPGDGTRTVSAQAAKGVDSSGALEVEGDHGSLRVSGMPPTHGGDVYQACIQDRDGGVHPSSVFVVADDGSGVVSIPSGLDGAAAVMVTREPRGGSETPSEPPLMTARLD